MKKLAVALSVVFILLAPPALADDREAVGKAQAAATSWLSLVDAGKYGASWDEAASPFRNAVGKTDWEKAVKGVRVPLGAVKSRKTRSATFSRTLPGAPDGEYVVIQLETSFENKAAAIETVTPMRDKDGTWRVSGYFVK